MIVILTVLAVARVTRLITTDRILSSLRAPVLKRLLPVRDGRVLETGWRYELAYLITCDWCASVYVGAAAAGAYAAWGETLPYMATVLALSASYVTGFLATVTERGE